jgi:hypothetical protein
MQAMAGTIQVAIWWSGVLVALWLVLKIWQLRITRTDHVVVTSSEEYRRLSEMAITSQEHTELKLSELNMQIAQLRDQLDWVAKILKDVE